MLKPHGYAQIIDPQAAAPLAEHDTASCGHCTAIILTKPGSASATYLVPATVHPPTYREEAGAFCRVCMRPVCLRCHAIGRCLPWERALEQSEARDRLRRSVV